MKPYNAEHATAIRLIVFNETLNRKDLEGLNITLLNAYIREMKNGATKVLKQLKNY